MIQTRLMAFAILVSGGGGVGNGDSSGNDRGSGGRGGVSSRGGTTSGGSLRLQQWMMTRPF